MLPVTTAGLQEKKIIFEAFVKFTFRDGTNRTMVGCGRSDPAEVSDMHVRVPRFALRCVNITLY